MTIKNRFPINKLTNIRSEYTTPIHGFLIRLKIALCRSLILPPEGQALRV